MVTYLMEIKTEKDFSNNPYPIHELCITNLLSTLHGPILSILLLQ